MTSKTTYREKGRAVVLAALMVLSVVAMSAAFAGGAAAKQPEDPTSNVQYTSPSELSGDLWIGQQVTIGSSDESSDAYIDKSGVEIYSGLTDSDNSDNDERITTVKVKDGQATINIDPDKFTAGEPYHIQAGDSSWSGVDFWVESENLNTEFATSSVSANSQTSLKFESDRADQWVNVTADGLGSDQLKKLFDETPSEVQNDDTLALDVSGVDGSTSLAANFSKADVDAGEYNFTFDVTDSNAEDTATINVTDARLDYEFANVESVSQGEIANITVDVSSGSSAVVTFGDRSLGYDSYARLTNIQSDQVVLQYNTHNASGQPWSLHDSEAADLEQGVDHDLKDGQAFPAYDWDLTIGEGLNEETTDGKTSYDVDNEHDRARLVITKRTDIGDVKPQTAPATATLNGFEDYNETTVTQTNTIANQDHLIVKAEDFGAEGLVKEIAASTDGSTSLSEALAQEGIYAEITEQSSGPIGSPTSWNTSDELSVTGLTVDKYSGDLVFAIDNVHNHLEPGQSYDFAFNVTQKNSYVSNEKGEISKQSTITIEKRDVAWDEIASLPANEDATATGTTTVAPGTELSAEADSPTSQGGFVQVSDAVVSAGDDGKNQFSAQFDLSEEEPGVSFDLIVEDTQSDSSDTLKDVKLTQGGEDQPDITVSGSAPSEVEVNGSATLDVTVTNNADENKTVNYSVTIDGEDVSETDELEVPTNDSVTKSYEFDTSEAGDISWEVTAGDDSDSGTLTVTEEPSDGSSDGSSDGGSDGSSEDGVPGFGVSVALVALLGAAMLALRQQD